MATEEMPSGRREMATLKRFRKIGSGKRWRLGWRSGKWKYCTRNGDANWEGMHEQGGSRITPGLDPIPILIAAALT